MGQNWFQTLAAVKGGFDLAANALQMGRLDALRLDVRDAQDDENDAEKELEAVVNSTTTAPDLLTVSKAQIKWNKAQKAVNRAQQALDRAQNDAALMGVIDGVMELGGAVIGDDGADGGGGGGFGGGDALAAGLMGAGAGAVAGALVSSDRGSRRRRDR
jgi:hypothetical protein